MDPSHTIRWLVFILFSITISNVKSSKYTSCSPGMHTAGVTLPKGDIDIEYGNPLEIFCVLDPHIELNSSFLMFYQNEVEAPKENVKIVNDRTIRLFIEKPPVSQTFYACLLQRKDKREGVCANYVYVGTKPQEVNNFTCISYNWESLNCTWHPVPNPVDTKYKLSFALRGQKRNIFKCPGDSDINHNYCLWNSTSNPPYRKPYSEYTFILQGKNVLGNITTKYKIKHYAIVLPKEPEKLELIEATPNSLAISWSLPLALKEFPIEIYDKVTYQSDWDPPTDWKLADSTNIIKNGEKRMLYIMPLTYAYTWYRIRVSIKSSIAKDIDNWWSNNASIAAKTKPTVPAIPPKTIIGGFESVSRASDNTHRNLYVYWQLIPKKFENGEDFGYNITSVEEVVNGKCLQRSAKPIMQQSFALVESLSYNTHVFKIVSCNKEGCSQNYSSVFVSSKPGSPEYPERLKTIAYDHGVFEISWKPPQTNVSEQINVTNYTIFWCPKMTNKPYGCNGPLNWTIVNSNITKINVTLLDDEAYQFSVSANSINASSGMIWAKCTIHHDQVERGYFSSIWVNNVGSNYIELSWKLECTSSPINGFFVDYCPIQDIKQPNCEDKDIVERKFTEKQYSSHYNISGLQPYTTYKIRISLVSVQDSLMSSEELLHTTLEAPPSGPPVNFKALKITNTSVTLSWGPPPILNGVLKHYKLFWNNSLMVIKDKSIVVEYKLRNLSSYENYLISLTACTVACSKKYASLSIRTKIGVPAILNSPIVAYSNETKLNITWFPLKSHRGGRNDYYKIKIQFLNEDKNKVINETVKIFNSTKDSDGNEGKMEILTTGCQEEDSSAVYRVQVKAVNEDHETNLTFEGPWSPPAEGFCHPIGNGSFSMVILIIVWILLSFVACSILTYIVRFTFKRFRAMQDIQVNLPPQLELEMNQREVSDKPLPGKLAEINAPPPLPSPNEPGPSGMRDTVELIESSSDDCEDLSCNRGSSGCGSGDESVVSVATAVTYITNSEPEPKPKVKIAVEVHKEEEPTSPDLSPRQRSISIRGEGYCVLTQAPSGYVSLHPKSDQEKPAPPNS